MKFEQHPDSHLFRLGEAWVSLERREVFSEDGSVRLGSRAFDVLEMLLAAPNRLVTKDELIQVVWHNRVVEDNNLQVHISTLRKVLKLDRNVLETVPRRGYRLNIGQLPQATPPAPAHVAAPLAGDNWKSRASVHIVDDEPAVRSALVRQLRSYDIAATAYRSAEAFLSRCDFTHPACLLLDVRLNQGSGFDLQTELTRREAPIPIVFMSGFGTIDQSVRAMKAGAEGFLTKPFDEPQLLASVRDAIEQAASRHAQSLLRDAVRTRFAELSPREQEVFDLLVGGHISKHIAQRLGLQEVTVKVHKKHIMTKLGTRTLVDLLLVGKMLDRLPDLHPPGFPPG